MKKLFLLLTMALCISSIAFSQNCNPPRDLQGTTTKDKVILSWKEPAQSGTQEEITWCTGDLANGIGVSSTTEFICLHKWSTADIADYVGWQVIKISFSPYANGNFKLKAYEGTGTNPTGNGILTQNISSVTVGAWNNINITNPFPIQNNKNYWFGYSVAALNSSDYPAGADAGPAVVGKGDVVGLGNQWTTLSANGLNYNWCIKTTLQNAKGETKDVYITNATVESYNVYRDEKKIGSTEDLTYTDTGLEMETSYHYCVEAVYDDGCISPQICGDFETQGPTCVPPQNVLATPYLNTVTITWERPYVPSSSEWITWSGEPGSNAIGTGQAADFYVAQRFTKTEMAPYGGYQLKKIKFVPAEAACTYTVKVWTGGNGLSNPGTLVVNQEVPASSIVLNSWNEVTLNTPVEITGGEDVWFGYECNTTTGFPAGVDDGPAVDGFGNLMYMGQWITLLQASADLNYNWAIQGYVEIEGKAAVQLSPIASNDNTFGNISDITAYSHNNSIFKLAPRPIKNMFDNVASYKIYRDEKLIGTVDTATYQFVDNNVEDGKYNYCVTAVYDNNCESVPICSQAEVSSTCWPVSELEYKVLVKKNVKLTWKEPIDPDAPTTWITWSGEPNGNAIGTGGAADFYVAHRFEPTDLTDYSGMQLVAIKMVPHVAGGQCTYTLRVWTGGSQSAPETLVTQQEIPEESIVVDQWNMFYLDTPITIDASKELWIGYECNTTTGYPAGTDAGPRVDYKGNMMYFGGKWTTMYEAGGSNNLDFNWTIQGGLKSGNGKSYILSPITESPATTTTRGNEIFSAEKFTFNLEGGERAVDLDYYNVYRNNEIIKTNLKSKSYTDMDVHTGDYVYGVTAVYVNGCESDAVNTESIHIDNDGINTLSSGVKVYPNPANDIIKIEGVDMTNIVIYNSLGQIVSNLVVNGTSTTIVTNNYRPGLYFIDIHTANGTIKTNIVVSH